jgi:hypothetical protein
MCTKQSVITAMRVTFFRVSRASLAINHQPELYHSYAPWPMCTQVLLLGRESGANMAMNRSLQKSLIESELDIGPVSVV